MDTKLSANFETITPELATALIQRNTHNRLVSQVTVNKYADDLRAGRWGMNGEAIKIAEDGTLLDGQHRLWAVIETGISLDMLVVRGLPIKAQDTMDLGRKRSVSDALTIDRVKYASTVAAIAGLLLKLRGSNQTSSMHSLQPSSTAVRQFVDAHIDELVASASAASGARSGSPVPRIATGVLHYVATNHMNCEFAVGTFIEVLKSGVPTYTNDPAYRLREKLMRLKMSGTTLKTAPVLAATANAFTHFIDQKPLSKVFWKGTIEFPGVDLTKL